MIARFFSLPVLLYALGFILFARDARPAGEGGVRERMRPW